MMAGRHKLRLAIVAGMSSEQRALIVKSPARALLVKHGLALGGKSGEADRMTPQPISHRRHRFPAEIISHAIWLYHVFGLSLRDVELILVQRGTRLREQNNRKGIVSYHRRYHSERPISTSRAEGCVDEIGNAGMSKRRRMRWSPRGALIASPSSEPQSLTAGSQQRRATRSPPDRPAFFHSDSH